jgi:ribosomal protein S18 acetylase RimI-like enzyme
MDLFLMCERLETSALTAMPAGFHVRFCREDELEAWKAMHFDDPESARRYHGFMTDYFRDVYAGSGDRFFRTCRFACDGRDRPVATCFAWKAYGRVSTIHWFKVLPPYEGLGIGRALLSDVMRDLPGSDYPVFLHTHPSSVRAIKLYSDFGFVLLEDPVVGTRRNDLAACLPDLERDMPPEAFRRLRFGRAPEDFLRAVDVPGPEQF